MAASVAVVVVDVVDIFVVAVVTVLSLDSTLRVCVFVFGEPARSRALATPPVDERIGRRL